jgi:hypothetical protein
MWNFNAAAAAGFFQRSPTVYFSGPASEIRSMAALHAFGGVPESLVEGADGSRLFEPQRLT